LNAQAFKFYDAVFRAARADDVGGRQQTTRIIAASPCPEQKHKIGDLWRPYFADDSKCRGLTGCVRRMRPARIAPVDRVEQIAELRRRDRDGAVRRARPDEPARFETLGVKRQADAVVRQRTLIMSPRRPRKTKRSPAWGYVARHISTHMCRA